MPKNVVHIVTLKSIGGEQTSFLPFFKMAKKESDFNHFIMSQYGTGEQALCSLNHYNDTQYLDTLILGSCAITTRY